MTEPTMPVTVEQCGEPCRLDECPPGPFLFNGSLGFRSEYWSDDDHKPDAYCMDSGEYFWGGADNATKRAALIVQPVALNTRATPPSPAGLNPILAAVVAEVEKATRKFPTWPTRIIDAGNVVSEEAGELAKACLQVTYEKHKETLEGVRMEAIQTAAMCLRFLASMDRYDTTPADQHEQPAFATLDAKDQSNG